MKCWDVIELGNLIIFLCVCVCLQIKSLSEEDLDAYLSQAVCVRLKSPQELGQIQVSHRCRHK